MQACVQSCLLKVNLYESVFSLCVSWSLSFKSNRSIEQCAHTDLATQTAKIVVTQWFDLLEKDVFLMYVYPFCFVSVKSTGLPWRPSHSGSLCLWEEWASGCLLLAAANMGRWVTKHLSTERLLSDPLRRKDRGGRGHFGLMPCNCDLIMMIKTWWLMLDVLPTLYCVMITITGAHTELCLITAAPFNLPENVKIYCLRDSVVLYKS